MLQKIDLKNVLFLDIETVPAESSFEQLSEEEQNLFAHKTAYQRKTEETSASDFYERAGIWAEFGKIICISVGYFMESDQLLNFRIKSFFGEEDILLNDFSQLIHTHFSKPEQLLCAHNGKEFDFPFIARRMIVNGINIPEKLNLFGKKPWEVAHLDTLELWKFGDYKHYTSLHLLTHILGIPSPKGDIDGSKVAEAYYVENDLERIVKYCERDVLAVAQVVLKFQNKPILEASQIIFTS
jgi:3'-5' exonuclease